MELKISGLCRGDGKTYIAVLFTGLSSDSVIDVSNTLPDGSLLPCSFHTISRIGNKCVATITIPILEAIRQQVHFIERRNNTIVSEKSRVFFPRQVKWWSRFNYKLKPYKMECLKRSVQDDRYNHASVKFTEIIVDFLKNEYCIRTNVIIPAVFEEAPNFHCYNERGEALLSAAFILDDNTVSAPGFPEQSLRAMHLSVRIKQPLKGFTLKVLDSKSGQSIGYGVLDKYQIRKLRKTWIDCVLLEEGEIYRNWLEAHKLPRQMLDAQRSIELASKPLFSIVVPLYKTPISFLKDMISSVMQQSYDNWELILVNASPNDNTIKGLIKEYCNHDNRIRCITLEENLGIVGNTQIGGQDAKGDFICFLDHDDVLELNALFEYAKAISRDPEIEMLYCDEDIMSERGEPKLPIMKPDFCLDTLHTKNYITHFLAIKTKLYKQLEVQNLEVEGAQDYDISLKAAEKTRHIHHVPRILYHWRESASSTAKNPETKKYAVLAGQRALQKHLDRMNISAEVQIGNDPFTYFIKYKFPDEKDEQVLISILIPTKDHSETLRCCLDSIIHKSTYKNYEIILIENNSIEKKTFEYYDEITTNDKVRIVVWEGEWNYSKINNFGAKFARGDYFIFLNNDTEVIASDWIEQMLGICQRQEVGVVGAKLYYPDDTIQHAGVIIGEYGPQHMFSKFPKGDGWSFGLLNMPLNLSAVTAACMMTDSELFKLLNGFDESFSIAYNDVDYCLRARELGFAVIFSPYVELYHFESLSRSYEVGEENRIRFATEKGLLFRRWPKYFGMGDPCVNPNLDCSTTYLRFKKQ